MPAGVQKIEDRRARAPHVQEPGRRRCKSEFHAFRPDHGFTLVELLFALLILTIVIMTSLAVFVERTRRLRQAGDIMIAYQVLANEAEIVRRVPYNNLDSLSGFTTDLTLLRSLQNPQARIEAGAATSGIRRVELIIQWDHGRASMNVYRVDTGGGPLW
jgi:prepilin-type N-terminal cleavage/methylation domain-containing protein